MKAKLFSIIIVIMLLITVFTGCSSEHENVDKKPLLEGDYAKVPLSASWSYNYADIEELSNNSDIIAVVKVSAETAGDKYIQNGIMQTIYTVEVLEAIHGDFDNEIQIVMTGGVSEEEKKIYEIADDPLMDVNDEYVIFAKENSDGTYRALSGFQGRYAIIDGSVYSLNAINEQVKEANSFSNITVSGILLDDFIEQIKQYTEVSE